MSRAEGFVQTVTGIDGEWLISELVIEPNAPGPPLHFHESFDEQFSVAEGTLHVRVNGEVKKVGPGESILVPAGVPHQPFNPTAKTAATPDTPRRKTRQTKSQVPSHEPI